MHKVFHMLWISIASIISDMVSRQNYKSDTVLPNPNSITASPPLSYHNSGSQTSFQSELPSLTIL